MSKELGQELGSRGALLKLVVGVEVYVTVDFGVRFTRVGFGSEDGNRGLLEGVGGACPWCPGDSAEMERPLLPSKNRTTFYKYLGITPDWPCALLYDWTL